MPCNSIQTVAFYSLQIEIAAYYKLLLLLPNNGNRPTLWLVNSEATNILTVVTKPSQIHLSVIYETDRSITGYVTPSLFSISM